MKHIYILLIILGSVTVTHAQSVKPAPVISRYYYFTGTIDKYPVTFNLYRINDNFTGSYYYSSTEKPIELVGTLSRDNMLSLSAYGNEDDEPEKFTGNFKDSSFSGTWSDNKGKLLSFRVTQKKSDGALTFDYIFTEGSKKLPKVENIYRDEISYDAATIWPTAFSTHPAANLIKETVFKAFGYENGKGEIGKAIIDEKNSLIKGKINLEEIETYAISRRIQIEYRSDKLLTISHYTYTDGGGAHGNYGISYTCIDLVHNTELSLGAILDTSCNDPHLLALLEKKYREAYKVPNDQKISGFALVDTIPVTNNISITSKGISFNYVPYEIAAYAMGEVRLFIPFKEISGCLKPEFKQLIGMKK